MLFRSRVEGGSFKCSLFDYPLNDKQREKLKDYDGKEVILGVRPENVTRSGPVKLLITNNENLGMNTLVHGKVGGKKIVICKFAEWCNYKPGDEIGIGFNPDMTHFFELPVQEFDANGKLVNEIPGKAIR